jgi:hypothetical protein
MTAPLLGEARVQMLKDHLQAQLNVEFFTIPFYLTAIGSFTKKALNYTAADNSQPLSAMQQLASSVAVQEMYHLQEACNLANAFDVLPEITPAARNFPTGQDITVPHLAPDSKQLTARMGNLADVIAAMVAVEQPDPKKTFPPPNPAVVYPAISDLYHATLVLIAEYMKAYRAVPTALDPHFTPNQRQIAYGAFATRYVYNKIANREDFGQAANAIADQGEGREVVPVIPGLFQSGENDQVAKPYQARKGSRFYEQDLTTHYHRFLTIQTGLDGNDWAKTIGGPVFYTADGTASPDLPGWAPSYHVCQKSMNTIWSYLCDVMVDALRAGTLGQPGGAGPSFTDAMLSFKYIIPMIWQHGYCPAFAYTPGVTVTDVSSAMDTVDPLCLFHWDDATVKVRATYPKNACQGLNACKSQGWGGIATTKGDGACATADMHSCQGGNSCSLQGGCAFLSTVDGQLLKGPDQWVPGSNAGASSGGCQTPIATAQVFYRKTDVSSVEPVDSQARLTSLIGTSVWAEARALFGQRESVNPLPNPTSRTIGPINYDGDMRRAAVAATSK